MSTQLTEITVYTKCRLMPGDLISFNYHNEYRVGTIHRMVIAGNGNTIITINLANSNHTYKSFRLIKMSNIQKHKLGFITKLLMY